MLAQRNARDPKEANLHPHCLGGSRPPVKIGRRAANCPDRGSVTRSNVDSSRARQTFDGGWQLRGLLRVSDPRSGSRNVSPPKEPIRIIPLFGFVGVKTIQPPFFP